jgi:NAD(P)H-dependent FMN reductase
MPRDTLCVTPAHLRELAERHHRAAEDLTAAIRAADGVGPSVSATHGTVAAVVATALDAVTAAREAAGGALAGTSRALAHDLTAAAAGYQARDEASHAELSAQLRAP